MVTSIVTIRRSHLAVSRLATLSLIGFFIAFVDASARPRSMVRPVKFLCIDAASIEVVGVAILAARQSEVDEDAAARRAAKPLIEAGTCTLLPKRVEVHLMRIMKWLSAEMAIWEVESPEGRTRYALSVPAMDQLSRGTTPRPG